MGSRGRSSYYGNGGGVGFFGSSSDRLLHPAATRHDDVSASAAAADHLADLDEEDVWSAVATNDNRHHHHRNGGALMQRRPAYAGGGLSLAFEASSPPARHSAPVSVPEWPAATLPDDGGCGEWVPPHEYLQRRWCGGATASSVLEGAGRTLKGRDITRVRDAVWSKTGFFG
ncbi:protein S40-5-like [Miscanthus floridulus]|uniref:protein S40-5-like n=1 Tax=Miscanthus floridulus TaxID=154761 RepID=UPI00345AECA8